MYSVMFLLFLIFFMAPDLQECWHPVQHRRSTCLLPSAEIILNVCQTTDVWSSDITLPADVPLIFIRVCFQYVANRQECLLFYSTKSIDAPFNIIDFRWHGFYRKPILSQTASIQNRHHNLMSYFIAPTSLYILTSTSFVTP